MELLLLVVEPLNKFGVGVEEGSVVESVVGLLTIKENAGFGAAGESVPVCPKVKVGFGASAEVVSLLSAGLPKANTGAGGCVCEPSLPKENPPVEGAAGAASASLLVPPKTKADEAEAADSFFSSGFPKVNVGALGCLSVCTEPNVAPPCGVVVVEVVVAKLGSPSLPKTEPVVLVVVVDKLVSVDVMLEDVTLSLFSSEETGGVMLTEDEVVVVVVSDVFSSGFAIPKVKPLLDELLSLLDNPVPNTIPPLVLNLDQPAAGSGSDFLSSEGAAPNLKPSDELPNLNPDVAVVSLDVVSDVELPNLNPPEDEEDSENEPPNLKPPDPDPEVLSDVPNLKPPEEPKVEEPEAPAADDPNAEPKALVSTLAPGLVA